MIDGGVDIKDYYFIGGSPCSGKTTVSKEIAKEFGMYHYICDDHIERHIALAVKNDGFEIPSLDSEERDDYWISNVSILLRRSIRTYQSIWKYIVFDLEDIKFRPVIAEGCAILPDFVASLRNLNFSHLSLVSTKSFHLKYYLERPWVIPYLEHFNDKREVYLRWMKRDQLFSRYIIRRSKKLNLEYISVDREHREVEIVSEAKKLFKLM